MPRIDEKAPRRPPLLLLRRLPLLRLCEERGAMCRHGRPRARQSRRGGAGPGEGSGRTRTQPARQGGREKRRQAAAGAAFRPTSGRKSILSRRALHRGHKPLSEAGTGPLLCATAAPILFPLFLARQRCEGRARRLQHFACLGSEAAAAQAPPSRRQRAQAPEI
jgi:hypothetical protein